MLTREFVATAKRSGDLLFVEGVGVALVERVE